MRPTTDSPDARPDPSASASMHGPARAAFGRTVAAVAAVVALAASGWSFVADVDASAQSPVLAAPPEIVFEGDPAVERNFVITRADEPTRIVAESGWTSAPSWTPDAARLDVGGLYESYVLVDPHVEGGAIQYSIPNSKGAFSDDPVYRDPTVAGWSVAQGPDRFEIADAGANAAALAAPSAQAEGSTGGLRARFWPHFASSHVSGEYGGDVEPGTGTKPMATPEWGVSQRINELGAQFWIIRSRPQEVFDQGRGPNENNPDMEVENALYEHNVSIWDDLLWGAQEVLTNIGLNIGWAGCEAASSIGSAFGAKPIDCDKELYRDPELEIGVEIMFEAVDDGAHVLWNTNDTQVEPAAETFVGRAGATGDGFEYDWSESTAGMFPLLSGYSTKMLGYLEVDADDVTADENGYVELTFGVKGPAGAQAWIEGVGATDITPGQRVQLGPDDALAAEPFSATATAATWVVHPDDLALKIGESEGDRDERLFDQGVGANADRIVEVQDEIVEAMLDAPPMEEPAIGDPVRLRAGVRYPLTLLAWSAFVPGEVGLYVDAGDGPEPVPLDWLTPALEGTTGFNDPVFPDGALDIGDSAYAHAISSDGTRIAELSEEGLTTAMFAADGTWQRASPITADGEALRTIGQADAETLSHWPQFVSLDNRVAINGDGTVVAAAADAIGGAGGADVVVAETATPWLDFDDAATVTRLSGALATAGAEPFREQDGTLQSRNLAMTASGDELVVSEVWLADPDGATHRVVPGTAGSRITVFARDAGGDWSLIHELAPVDATDPEAAVTATTSDGAHLWTANDGSTAVTQIDAATGRTLAVVDVGLEAAALATDGHVVAAIAEDGAVVAIDIDTRTPSDAVSASTISEPSDAVIVAGDLFVANVASTKPVPVATRIDLSTGATIASYGDPGRDHDGGLRQWPATKGAEPDLAVDDAANVWVSQPATDQLHRIDPRDDAIQSVSLAQGAAQVAFDGSDIIATYAWLVPPAIGGTHDEPELTYEFAYRIDPTTLAIGDPLTVVTSVPFDHTGAPLAADPISSTVYLAVSVEQMPMVLTIDTGPTPTPIVDYGPLATDGALSAGAALYTLPVEVSRWSLPATSLDVVNGQVWVSAQQHDRSDAQLAALTPNQMTAVGHGGVEVGARLDVFGASVDIAADPSGVLTLVTTTPSGAAVYAFEPDGVRKTFSARTLATTATEHNNAVALSDDAQRLFISEPETSDTPGRLVVYADEGDHWGLLAHLVAPYDETSEFAQPVGGKVKVQGRFMTLAGHGNTLEPAPVWIFRDVFGDWGEFKTWSSLAHPDHVTHGSGSGNVDAIAGGRGWTYPMALVGHRPWDGYDTPMGGQRATQPFTSIITYTELPVSVGSEGG